VSRELSPIRFGGGPKVAKTVSVKTEIPGPKSKALLERRAKAVPAGVGNTVPVFIESAKGAVVTDVDGNRYLDFAGGIGVLNVGSVNPGVTRAVIEQLQKYTHTCFHVVMYEPYVALAEKLASLTPGEFPKKAVLVNSGAEAVENGIKIARKATGRPTIVTLENAFHGRTLLAMSLTSKVMPYKAGFGPFAPDILRIPSAYCYRCAYGLRYPGCDLLCAGELERLIISDVVKPESVAAVLVEPVQGEGGFIVPPRGYFERLRQTCDKYGIIFIVDEIQTGFGRTGRMFAIEHSPGVAPDMILVAKSLGAGFPIAGVVGRAEIMDAVHPGGIGGTYGGNPVACVAALEVIKQMEEGLVKRGQTLGDRIMARCLELQERFPIVGEVRGLGAMVAMELVTDRQTKEPAKDETAKLVMECCRRGAIVLKAGTMNNVIRFLAPLTITDEQLDEGLDIVAEALRVVGLSG
jgi:4-aminobutyrate aminotransferase/(S)-3-amino-2-methylpropionate transaminase